jgi:hypothetical protein
MGWTMEKPFDNLSKDFILDLSGVHYFPEHLEELRDPRDLVDK